MQPPDSTRRLWIQKSGRTGLLAVIKLEKKLNPVRQHRIQLGNQIEEAGDTMAATELATAGTGTPLNVDDPKPRASHDRALGPDRQIPILSVSPDEGDHAVLLQILDELPFLLTTAHTCQEAAAYLKQGAFGIILCECKLPDGSWIEILNQVSGGGHDPLLIVTSRLADVSLWAEVLNLGGYDLIAKPFNHQEVRHVLTSAWVQRANPVRRVCVAGAA
jgi:CheY-like chemotaxis protein